MGSEDRLSKAIWNRGTEVRLKRFLAKAKRGEGFTVGVVGGSGMYLDFKHTISIHQPPSIHAYLTPSKGTLHHSPIGGSHWCTLINSIRRTWSTLQQTWKMVWTTDTIEYESSDIRSSRLLIPCSGRSGDRGGRWKWEERVHQWCSGWDWWVSSTFRPASLHESIKTRHWWQGLTTSQCVSENIYQMRWI